LTSVDDVTQNEPQTPKVAIVMGSDSDLPVMEETAAILRKFAIPFEMTIASAHRSPKRAAEFAATAGNRGIHVIIAGAGHAAHLAGAMAAYTSLPVIGVPIDSSAFQGLDALLSTVQMPPGIPVATVAVGKPGAKNAGVSRPRFWPYRIRVLPTSLQLTKTKWQPRLIKKLKNYYNINNIIELDPDNPAPEVIGMAAGIINSGGVVLVPTRCLYGLGADAFNAAAVHKVFEIKNRPVNNPILVLIKSTDELDRLAVNIPAYARRIMDKFWPGKVTIVFKAQKDVSALLTAGTGKIGVRLPEQKVARALVRTCSNPITGTSANLSGNAGCFRVADLEPKVAGKLDMIIDAGPLKGGVGSTVIDVTSDALKILREGEVMAEDILSM
jgi:L-threonylcarbamoyladenylate synthase